VALTEQQKLAAMYIADGRTFDDAIGPTEPKNNKIVRSLVYHRHGIEATLKNPSFVLLSSSRATLSLISPLHR
jgi:hypothetical protein